MPCQDLRRHFPVAPNLVAFAEAMEHLTGDPAFAAAHVAECAECHTETESLRSHPDEELRLLLAMALARWWVKAIRGWRGTAAPQVQNVKPARQIAAKSL